MPGHLGPVAAGRHVAPLAAPRARSIGEDPAAPAVLADPQPAGFTLDQLTGQALGQAGHGPVDRIALMAVLERDAVWARGELVDVMGPQRPVQLGEVAQAGRPAVDR